jgi:hypothetical protein
MKNETALDFIARRGLLLSDFFGRRLGGGGRVAARAAEQEPSMGKFLNEAARLEFGEHLEEGAAVVFLDMEAARKVLEGDRIVSKLKKTKDIIEIQMGGARHGMALSGSETGAAQF